MTTFKLPDLPFPENALEPYISRTTMETHHGKHHAAYIKKTNGFLAEKPNAPNSLEEVVRLAKKEGDKKLFNNSAQAWNHAFFWNCLTPQEQTAEGNLKRAIEKQWKSVDDFRTEFTSAGENHFASGWVWLLSDDQGALQIKDLHDADTPITYPSLTPILVCDVWEHAYYLDYKNDRGAFLKVFFDKLLNWRFAEKQYECARAGGRDCYAFPNA